MSNKTQSEYKAQISSLVLNGETTKAAKLLYQWVKVGKLNQATTVEIITYMRGF